MRGAGIVNNAFDLFRKIKPIFRATKLICTELYQVAVVLSNQLCPCSMSPKVKEKNGLHAASREHSLVGVEIESNGYKEDCAAKINGNLKPQQHG